MPDNNLFQNGQNNNSNNQNVDDGFEGDLSFDDLFLGSDEEIIPIQQRQPQETNQNQNQGQNQPTQTQNQYDQEITSLKNQLAQVTQFIIQSQQQNQQVQQQQNYPDPTQGRPMREWINEDGAENIMAGLITNIIKQAVQPMLQPLTPVVQNYQQQVAQQNQVGQLMQKYPDMQQVIGKNPDVARQIYQQTGGNVEAVYFALKQMSQQPNRNQQVDPQSLQNMRNMQQNYQVANNNGVAVNNGNSRIPKSPKEAARMAISEFGFRN